MNEMEDGKPPPTKDSLRNIAPARILSSPDNRSITRRREMAFIQHLSSPSLASRLRNDCYVLGADG